MRGHNCKLTSYDLIFSDPYFLFYKSSFEKKTQKTVDWYRRCLN
jgi:hypothetical protein